MASTIKREALRGAEVHTLDLVFEVLTSEQWAEWLKAPLERATAKGKRDLAQRLVEAGAEIGDALHAAVRRGHGEIVNDLLESRASITAKDTDGLTPLHIAAGWGKTEMVQLLLLKGADRDALDNRKCTPLYLAALQGHVGASLALLAAGADLSLRCGQCKVQVIHAVAEKGHVEILRAVIEHGADLEATADTHQSTVLHYATNCNKTEAMDTLVKAGANIEGRGSGGFTPLHRASGGLHLEALLYLLKNGAAVNAQGILLETPLMFAVLRAGTQGSATVVDSLLRAGADETMVDDEGQKASDLVGVGVEEEVRLVEDFERVRELLASAPADKAWRRRGYLVLCRACPDRVQQNQVVSGTHHADAGRKTRNGAKQARSGEVAGGCMMDERIHGDWTVVVARLLRLQEEGIFRTIVWYL